MISLRAFIPTGLPFVRSSHAHVSGQRRRQFRFQQIQSYRSRHGPHPVIHATAESYSEITGAGNVRVYPSAINVSVGDCLVIEYEPPPGMFEKDKEVGSSGAMLLWTGGFSNWNGEEGDETLVFPMIPIQERRYRVSIGIPNYANSVSFGFMDNTCAEFDTNDGQYYRIHVPHQQRLDEKSGEDLDIDVPDGTSTDAISPDSPRYLDAEQEKTLHMIRAEAMMVGQEKGIGNILISQARDTFDRLDVNRRGVIPTCKVGEALEMMGFDLASSRIDDLVATYVADKDMSMTEFMLIYADLETNDEGINIV